MSAPERTLVLYVPPGDHPELTGFGEVQDGKLVVHGSACDRLLHLLLIRPCRAWAYETFNGDGPAPAYSRGLILEDGSIGSMWASLFGRTMLHMDSEGRLDARACEFDARWHELSGNQRCADRIRRLVRYQKEFEL